MAQYYVHNIDPFAINWGPVLIPWYWLFYFISLFWCLYLGLYLIKKQKTNISPHLYISYIQGSFISLLLGGRIFYFIFYNFSKLTQDPSKFFRIWEGGMSFHGAVIGVFLYSVYFAKKHQKTIYDFTDIVCTCVPIGLFLGRVGNFINGELAGKISNVPWAVVFPKLYDNNPRHPSQLYEAIGEGLICFFVMWLNRERLKNPGFQSSLFLICYAIARFFIEFFRLPDAQLGHLLLGLSMGQILCLVMLVCAFIVYRDAKIRHANMT